MVLPVKVTIDGATHLAHTVDISSLGARLGGIREQLKPGSTVDLQRGTRRARFEIKWVRQLGSNEIQIGVESLEGLDRFWGVDLSNRERQAKQEIDAFMSILSGDSKRTR